MKLQMCWLKKDLVLYTIVLKGKSVNLPKKIQVNLNFLNKIEFLTLLFSFITKGGIKEKNEEALIEILS